MLKPYRRAFCISDRKNTEKNRHQVKFNWIAERIRNMILTLFYAGATLMQQWRLRSITLGIANRIRDQATVSFHKTCIEGSDGEFDQN